MSSPTRSRALGVGAWGILRIIEVKAIVGGKKSRFTSQQAQLRVESQCGPLWHYGLERLFEGS